MEKRPYMDVREVKEAIGCGEGLAYKIIRDMNAELKEKGYLVISGKVSRVYFQEKIYGHEQTAV